MNLHRCYLTQNDCYKAGKTITPKGVMVHSTGANNPNLKRYVQPDDGLLGNNKNNNSWNRPGVSKCTHAVIGKLENGTIATYQTLPWNMRGWHSSTGKSGKSANDTHISFEICEDGLTDAKYFNAVYKEAVEFTAMLCKQFNFDPLADGVVICHSEGYKRGIASNHGDVMHWFPKHGKSMDDFRADVANEMGVVVKAPITSPSPAPTKAEPYRVKVTADSLNIRRGPGVSYSKSGVITGKGVYTIVETKNGWGKLKSGAGWINLSYTRKV